MVMLAMPLMLLQLGLGVQAAVKGFPMGKVYVMGSSWHLVGVLVLAAVNQGFPPKNAWTRYGFLLGSFAELMVFSLALAWRVKLLQDEKGAYQRELLCQNETEKERLEKLVGERTAELEDANRELEALARHDGLTGLFNRRFFDRELERQHRAARRAGAPLSLIICDIDHFKLYNDRLGRQAGDHCLRRVAGIVQGECKRATDFTARYGGEEFVVMPPGVDLAKALIQAERIRRAVTTAAIAHPASAQGRVSLSLGVAAPDPRKADAGPADLVSRADRALYRGKKEGRDRVSGG